MKRYMFAFALLALATVSAINSAAAQTSFEPAVVDSGRLTTSGKTDSAKFFPVEQVPEFPGGMVKLFNYLKINFKTPRNNGIEGRMIVTFIIERDGSVTNVRIARGLSDALDKEAVRVMTGSPKWHPGMQKGKPVRLAYSIPIQIPFN